MSVLVSDRKESKFEAVTYSIELHDAFGRDDKEDFFFAK